MSNQTRWGVNVSNRPAEPEKLYILCLFHEFFYGPFDSVEGVIEAISRLDVNRPMWDYDPFCVIYGDPDCADYGKLKSIPDEQVLQIKIARAQQAKRGLPTKER